MLGNAKQSRRTFLTIGLYPTLDIVADAESRLRSMVALRPAEWPNGVVFTLPRLQTTGLSQPSTSSFSVDGKIGPMYVEVRNPCAICSTSCDGIATCPDIDNILTQTCVGIGIHVRMHCPKHFMRVLSIT